MQKTMLFEKGFLHGRNLLTQLETGVDGKGIGHPLRLTGPAPIIQSQRKLKTAVGHQFRTRRPPDGV
jgi:hypothetical protein